MAPRISYVDPATMNDKAMLDELDRCRREGTPRPESQAIRAHVPKAFWSFANTWRDVFHTGVADHAIKELCRLYVSRSVLCEFCGNQRSIKATKAGAVEADYLDLINFESSTRYDDRQKAALAYAECITWDLPSTDALVGPAAQALLRARTGRDRLFHRHHHGPAALAPDARHRAPPDPRRHRRLDGAGLRGHGGAEALQVRPELLGEKEGLAELVGGVIERPYRLPYCPVGKFCGCWGAGPGRADSRAGAGDGRRSRSMRASLKQAAIVLVATFVVATPASAQGWYERSGPVYDGPYYDGPYYTGPYKGAFARLAYPDESRCLMERRARQPSWGWWGGSDWAGRSIWGTGSYTVRVCR